MSAEDSDETSRLVQAFKELLSKTTPKVESHELTKLLTSYKNRVSDSEGSHLEQRDNGFPEMGSVDEPLICMDRWRILYPLSETKLCELRTVALQWEMKQVLNAF